MTRILSSLFFVALGLLLFKCSSDPYAGKSKLDLLKYGIPITIIAPDSAEVVSKDLAMIKDVSVRGGDNYYIQIMASDARTTNRATVIETLKNEVKENPFFDKLIKDVKGGFIYESKIDSSNVFYGFKYVRIQGDKEYVFQNGFTGKFNLEEIEHMYDSVAQEGGSE